MIATVIQHTSARRKRGNAWSWTTRHMLLLGVVVTAIVTASWFAPKIAAPPQSAPATTPQRIAAPLPTASATPELVAVDATADLAGPPLRPAHRLRQAASRSGIPLNAAVTPSDNYEILSAAELDGISQARN